jgi:hypothetical protein
MSQRLVLVSDVSGNRKDKWITTYLAALHPHFEITYYDLQELGKFRISSNDLVSMRSDFLDNAWSHAQKSFIQAEKQKSKGQDTVYMGFGLGSQLVWETVAPELNPKSLWLVSSTELAPADHVGEVPAYFYYGERDECPKLKSQDKNLSIVPRFGSSMYMDDHIAQCICSHLIEVEHSLQSA